MTIVDGGTAEALGTAEVEGVDETAETAGAVDVDGLGGAKRAVKSKGPRAG